MEICILYSQVERDTALEMLPKTLENSTRVLGRKDPLTLTLGSLNDIIKQTSALK